jgi:cytoskeletal protein CcmA (bactofilin family)
MLKSEKFFGKRDSITEVKPMAPPASVTDKTAGVGLMVAAPVTMAAVTRAVPASIAHASAAAAASAVAANAEMRSKLTVGPNIKLKGVEITDCDTLVVEGRVEATIDSRVIQISEKGAFIGTAEFDIAEIRGEFDGDLTVRQKLVVFSSGRVNGKVRYGRLVIEEGGQLSGDVQLSTSVSKGLVIAAG